MTSRMSSRLSLTLLAAAFAAAAASGCGGSDGGWEDDESVVFTLAVPDTAFVGQPVSVRVTGVCGCAPCARFDGIAVAGSGHVRELRPLSRHKKHPTSPCPACDHFFDETVTLSDLSAGSTVIRAVSYGSDPVDTVVVLAR
jgi:hypothetical protein